MGSRNFNSSPTEGTEAGLQFLRWELVFPSHSKPSRDELPLYWWAATSHVLSFHLDCAWPHNNPFFMHGSCCNTSNSRASPFTGAETQALSLRLTDYRKPRCQLTHLPHPDTLFPFISGTLGILYLKLSYTFKTISHVHLLAIQNVSGKEFYGYIVLSIKVSI